MRLKAAQPRALGKPRPYAGRNANFSVPRAAHVSDGKAIEGRCVLTRDVPRFIAFCQRREPPARKIRGGFATCDPGGEGFDNLAGATLSRPHA